MDIPQSNSNPETSVYVLSTLYWLYIYNCDRVQTERDLYEAQKICVTKNPIANSTREKTPQNATVHTHAAQRAEWGKTHIFCTDSNIRFKQRFFFSLHSSRLPHSAQSHCGKYLAIHSRTYLEFFMDIRYILFAFEKCQSTKRNHFGLKYVPEQQYQQPHRSDRTCTVLESTHTRRIKCTYKMKLKTHTKR